MGKRKDSVVGVWDRIACQGKMSVEESDGIATVQNRRGKDREGNDDQKHGEIFT